MALYPSDEQYAYYFVALLNSYFIFHYKRAFVSGNSAFQINDARQLPVIIPNREQLAHVNKCVQHAIVLSKKKQTKNTNKYDALLEQIRLELDEFITDLYKSW